MKRLLTIIAAVLMAITGSNVSAQNVNYLTISHKPQQSLAYTPASEMFYQSNLEQTFENNAIPLGGVNYKQGFCLRTLYGPTQHGYVEYSLKGKYDKIMFILGGSPFHSASRTKGVFAVTADGRKILDKVVEEHSAPERITLDIKGVDRLRFEIVTGDISVGIVEPTLWTAGQTPRETGTLSLAKDRPTKLVSEIRPYWVGNFHRCVSPAGNDMREIKINGKAYTSGLEMRANMQLIGNGESWTLFNLGGEYSQLRFIAGPEDSSGGTLGTAWLTIKCDGKIIYEYEIFEGNIAREITLDVKGCRQLSFESEQSNGSSSIAIANIMVYPEGMEPSDNKAEVEMVVTDDYKGLPDVCKLISNIPPYAMAGTSSAGQNVFDGKSEHITFSMGGTRFSEGIVLQSNSNLFDDNTRAHALFYLAGEFDYMSFTAGWVGKCGVLKNDTLRVYTDTDIALEVPLIATSPNQHYVVPLHKCKRLTFEKRGMSSLSHPAFGVADIVVYRGEPVENDLFVHPVPELPEEIDLIDLGKPYIHYISPMRDHMDQVFYDGSTQKRYFSLGNQRINKGFILQTSVHFDLEAGPLGNDGGSTGAMAGALGGSVMLGTVGGATMSAVFPFGALIALAAGGTAMESSCAAFNTYGAYDELTFTVASLSPAVSGVKERDREKLLIGGDGQVLQEFEIVDSMEPTTFTMPIGKCSQLMFWIQCGSSSSGKYVFYDLKLRKTDNPSGIIAGGASSLAASAGAIAPTDPYSLPVIGFTRQNIEWTKPKTANVKYIDSYFYECQQAKNKFDSFLGTDRTTYSNEIRDLLGNTFDKMSEVGAAGGYHCTAKYVSCSDGQVYRSFEVYSEKGKQLDFLALIQRDKAIIQAVKDAQLTFANLKLSQANANMSLVEAGFGAVAYGKAIKQAAAMIKAYREQLDALVKEKEAEIALLESLIGNALDIDGTQSTTARIFVK